MRYLSKQIYRTCILNARFKKSNVTLSANVYGKKAYSTANDPDPSLRPVKANLVLKGGQSISGYSFGYNKSKAGEIVFNTGLVG